MVGMGRRSAFACLRFNLYQASFACNSRVQNQDCNFDVYGLRYNSRTGQEELVGVYEEVSTPACTATKGALTSKTFTDFTNLSALLIRAKSDGTSRNWWLDDLAVGWNDNSCDAAHCRAAIALNGMKRDIPQTAKSRRELWALSSTGLRRVGGKDGRRGK
jgi:hypothetical protein